MTNSTLEDRLRSHYASVADRLVLSESDFDDVPLIPVRTAQVRSPCWRLRCRRGCVDHGRSRFGIRRTPARPHGHSGQRPGTAADSCRGDRGAGEPTSLDGMHDRTRHHTRHAGRGWWTPVLRSRRGHDNASSRRLPSSPHCGRIRRALRPAFGSLASRHVTTCSMSSVVRFRASFRCLLAFLGAVVEPLHQGLVGLR